MKTQWMAGALGAMILTSWSQEVPSTDGVTLWTDSGIEAAGTNEPAVRHDHHRPDPPLNREDAAEKQRYRVLFMERELKKIGVTEEQKIRIVELQDTYRKRMKEVSQRIADSREKLSRLMDEGASMEVLEAVIQEISEGQAEQLRILVRNRLDMERILGKEKNDEFMRSARTQFKKQGRRGGAPLPPRPGLPPTPDEQTAPPPAPGGHREVNPPVAP